MQTNNMEELYQQIGNTLNNMIPEEWDKLYAYAEISEFYTSVYFYYYPINKKNPVYSLDIEKKFIVDRKIYRDNEDELDEYFEELWAEFKNQNQEQWTNLTFILESIGKMKIEYGYEDLSEASPVETKNKWMKKYLGTDNSMYNK